MLEQQQQGGSSRTSFWLFMLCAAAVLSQLPALNFEISGNHHTGEYKYLITHFHKNSIINNYKDYTDHSRHHATTHHTTESKTNVGLVNHIAEMFADRGPTVRTLAGWVQSVESLVDQPESQEAPKAIDFADSHKEMKPAEIDQGKNTFANTAEAKKKTDGEQNSNLPKPW